MIQLLAALFAGLLGILTTMFLFVRFIIIIAIIIAVCYDPYGVANFVGGIAAAVIKPIVAVF